ncbi:MAG: ComF family protein [Pyrinomonadaceae bacterium]|nr:ComF family protein [Pyrinomonadaceae bacterium]
MSKKRLLARGFNQAELLAEIVSKHLQVQIDTRSLIRSKHAKVHRAGMDRRGRELSVKRSFEVKRVNKIKGKNILLIDDVLTSGATVSSCASVLKKSGAENVYVLTAARAA